MKLRFPQKKSKESAGRLPSASLSLVGPDLRVRGRLESSEEIQVRGVVAGEIAAYRVTLLADGYIEGSIFAEEAYFHGRFIGEATAKNVVISAGATIEGQIFHHMIEMEKGAHVDARLPWRPVNYFEHITENSQQSRGETHGEFYARRQGIQRK